MQPPKKVLFVCVENSARSQMAEGFLRKYSKIFEPISAGTQPISNLNPLAIQAMKEIDIDISNQRPKLLSNEMLNDSFKIVNMGCMDRESCPSLFVQDVIDWNILDPKGKSIEDVRQIRDQIKSEVLELIEKLEVEV